MRENLCYLKEVTSSEVQKHLCVVFPETGTVHLPAHCKELLMTGGQTVSCVHAQALHGGIVLRLGG